MKPVRSNGGQSLPFMMEAIVWCIFEWLGYDCIYSCQDCSGFVELTQWLPLKKQLWSLLCNVMVVFINQTFLVENLNFWCGNHSPQNVIFSMCLFWDGIMFLIDWCLLLCSVSDISFPIWQCWRAECCRARESYGDCGKPTTV
jgi:hypothetical protein